MSSLNATTCTSSTNPASRNCPNCGQRGAKNGTTPTGTQRYQCFGCGRKFTANTALGEAPLKAISPVGAHYVKGVSTLVGEDGQPKLQWIKTNAAAEDMHRQLEAVAQELQKEVRGLSLTAPKPAKTRSDQLTVYPWGDPHIGMYAWADECGEDFDVEIAERDLMDAMQTLVSAAPPTKEALIVNLGDFFHADNQSNTTSRSGNQLDVDTRWAHVIRVGVNVMRQAIHLAQQKHETVRVYNLIGNHDDHSSIALTEILRGYYHNNKRVVIDDRPQMFRRFRFGRVLIGMTHGHTVKLPDLAGIMAADWPSDWGETKHRYWLTGHIHHERKQEQRGCVVESFQTLAPKDAYHAANGYRAGRSMYRITYDKDRGEVERQKYSI